MYVSCIICINCALLFFIYFIELVRMSDLSDLIDKLDDDGVLHSADSTAMCGSGVIGAFPLLSRHVGSPFQVCF